MANRKLTDLTELTNLDNSDVNYVVDTSDTTESAQGTSKYFSFTTLISFLKTYFDTLYQNILVSGTNIKTVNGNSLLGSGDLVIGGGGKCVFFHSAIANTVLTGTTDETIMNDPLLMDADFLDNGSFDLIVGGLRVAPTAGKTYVRIYLNSSHSLTGATQIGIYSTPTSTLIRNLNMSRNITFNTTEISYSNIVNVQDDFTQANTAGTTIDSYVVKNNPYIIVTYQNDLTDTTATYRKIDLKIHN